ncbi:unnamed protein product [Oikopleura dioica]|uniref:Uncharacterized protein n=1 Tax=Oikopleura dioica TaxID=34765 RepID=E4X6H3_OIKDI|nr:unnamed protein product [Oikopleura dioica]
MRWRRGQQYRHVRTVVLSSKVRLCRLWLNVVRSSGPSRRPGFLANGRLSAFLYISTRDHAFGSFSSSFDRFFAAETVGLPSAYRRTRTGIAAWPARAQLPALRALYARAMENYQSFDDLGDGSVKEEDAKKKPGSASDDAPIKLSFDHFSLEDIISNGVPLMACSEDEFIDDLDQFKAMGFESREEYIKEKRYKMEERLGLSIHGHRSFLGVTDEDLDSGYSRGGPPSKRQKTTKMEAQVSLKDLYDSPPSVFDTKWPLQWFYLRTRSALASQVWGYRHGAICAIRALLKQAQVVFSYVSEEEKQSWLVDIALRLVVLLYLDRFGDFVSDSVVAPIRETASQGLGIACKLLPGEAVQQIVELLSSLVKSGVSGKATLEEESDIWPIRHGGLLGLRWVFAIDSKLLEFNFCYMYQLFTAALDDFSDDCRQVTAMILTECVEFICREHMQKAIELGRIAWRNILKGDDLTVSTASAVTFLSALMNHGKEELVYGSVGNDAGVVLAALLPLIFHSLSTVREATLESVNAMLAYDNFRNIDIVLQDTLNRTFFTVISESPKSKLSKSAVQIWARAVSAGSPDLLEEIVAATIDLWVALATTRDGRPIESKLISILKEHSLTDEIIYLGGEDDVNISAETRYTLCHMVSEIFLKMNGVLDDRLMLLITQSENGYTRLFAVEILFLMVRKGRRIDNFLPIIFELLSSAPVFQGMGFEDIDDHSLPIYKELKGPLTGLQISARKLGLSIGRDLHGDLISPYDAKTMGSEILNPSDDQKIWIDEITCSVQQVETVKQNLHAALNAFSGSTLLLNEYIPGMKLNPIVKPLLESVRNCSNKFTRDILATAFCSLLVLSYYTNLRDSVKYSKKEKKKAFSAKDGRERTALTYRRLSASHILTSFVQHYRHELPQQLPLLWEQLSQLPFPVNNDQLPPSFIDQLYLIVNIELLPHMMNMLQASLSLGSYKNFVLRYLVAHFIGKCCAVSPVPIIDAIFDTITEMLKSSNEFSQKGAIEILAQIVASLENKILPFTTIFMVPVLKVMSSQDFYVRQVASSIFAKLLKAMPLDSDSEIVYEGFTHFLRSKREESLSFLSQLFDQSKAVDYKIPIPFAAKLRPYQQDGVNWLMFLNKFGLNGILSDEMGLGKTLQTILTVASDHYRCTQNGEKNVKSIIISPPSVTGHWYDEVKKFVPESLSMIHYYGNGAERKKLRELFMSAENQFNAVIASYEVVRNDIDFFNKYTWNYCVLDEGHVIRNTKTKVSQSIRSIRARHRLMLTGTPIQNSVIELWSLFDFLMPGFLGTDKEFNTVYGRPILNSRDPRCKNPEAGLLALQNLHRQCLPFMLRRVKSDVLKDLPPKIIQDFYCELSPLQKRLYEEFTRSKLKKRNATLAIQYLQKLCNHPTLVLTSAHPDYQSIMTDLDRNGSSIRDIEHAPKIKALKQLLTECGIGQRNGSVVSEHRALIFCQHKSMLDIIERDLFKSNQLPSVSFSRLDGSVPAGARHGIVSRFNRDPTIDVLLLTTKVGGLGLNLTGADVVIFVEHDWNPQMDLQAMDRAHRIGQKKTVNVYRLITRNTVEEKIMGLQKFKLSIANSLVSGDNASMSTMDTHQLLDMFNFDKSAGEEKQKQKDGKSKSAQSLVDELGELWDSEAYDSEYEINKFLQKLNQ